METFSGKKLANEIFHGEMTLKRWVSDLLPNLVMGVVDANLLSREDKHFMTKEQCMSFVLKFGYGVYCGITKADDQCKGNGNETPKSIESICCNEHHDYRKI
ncbi:hypothetical protein CUMW_235230 [Citrus unshiu]|uniref:Uncharacterized protein n=1 Tax=Citrus unshiu TaxID=55188 RepID=A0A2H5QJ63_CITUN|nr:hypothetical protein CUMW_235230 [Citrus unshiu]